MKLLFVIMCFNVNLIIRIQKNIPFIFIIFLAVLLRFYNFPERITMGAEAARDAFVSLEGARLFQLPTTGPFTSIAPVTTGPWYWFQLILARIILPTNLAPWLLLGIYSVLMVLVMYLIGLTLSGKRLGLILGLITTISVNQIQVATVLTNPSIIGFYSSLVFFLFIILIKKGPHNRLGFLLGIIYGITLNTHYQALGFFSLPLTLFFFGKKYVKTLMNIFAGVFITFLPLLYFELNNHWYNTRHMLRYILVDQYNIWTPMRWLTYINDYWPRFIASVLGGDKLFGFIVMGAISLVFLIQIFRRNLPKIYYLFVFSFIGQVVIIRYYRGEKYFGYLQFFHPFLFLFIGYVINWIYKLKFGKILGSLVLVLYLFAVIPSSLKSIVPDDFTKEVHRLTSNVYKTFGPGPFKIYNCKNVQKWDITGLVLQLDIDDKYDSAGKPLIYKWGCTLPDTRHDGTKIFIKQSDRPEDFFLKMENLYDVSIASPSAILAEDWVEASPAAMYQSAARWWMDEQPYRAE